MRNPDAVSVISAAEQFAREVVGADDSPEYFQVLDRALAAAASIREDQLAEIAARSFDEQRPALGATFRGGEMTIFESSAFQENYREWLGGFRDGPVRPRVVGGFPTRPGQVSECVGVGSDQKFAGSGVLITPRVVLTAGHNIVEGLISRVYFGVDWYRAQPQDIVRVAAHKLHSQYAGPPDYHNDLGLLLLQNPVGIPPVQVAPPPITDQSRELLLCGFGQTTGGHFGQQNAVMIVVASYYCTGPNEPGGFGCHPGLEIVAGGNGFDSCLWDSGGPAYALTSTVRYLAGITSRRQKNTAYCGGGGIYVRVDRYRDWINTMLAGWGEPPLP